MCRPNELTPSTVTIGSHTLSVTIGVHTFVDKLVLIFIVTIESWQCKMWNFDNYLIEIFTLGKWQLKSAPMISIKVGIFTNQRLTIDKGVVDLVGASILNIFCQILCLHNLCIFSTFYRLHMKIFILNGFCSSIIFVLLICIWRSRKYLNLKFYNHMFWDIKRQI